MSKPVNLSNNYSLSLDDSSDGAIVKIGIEIKSEDEKLLINAEIIGKFDKRFSEVNNVVLHEVVDQLYPYLRCTVGELSNISLLPRIDIPPLNLGDT